MNNYFPTFRRFLLAAMFVLSVSRIHAEHEVDYTADAIVNAGGGSFAPYYISSNHHGIVTQKSDALIRGVLKHDWNLNRRFSYGYGIDLIGGWGSSTDYLQYTGDGATEIARHPSRAWIQQLYGEVKYRGVFLTAGLKEHGSALLNQSLSSGDLVESGNSRPIPEVRIGFIDFQNIPFTNGWLQIQGEISYGKYTDNKWMREHYNYLDYHLNQGALYTYKRCYFRTKPTMPLSVTFGMQVGASFGGQTVWYTAGVLTKQYRFSRGIRQFFKMLLPTDGGLDYYTGSTLGSWDVKFRYRISDRYTVNAYFQKPYEDGSGIGFLNGWDGIWGVEFVSSVNSPVRGVVLEYIDFTNQSGPMHWDPDDYPGVDITARGEGADDYYNNHEYNPYANYGMAIGTPFMVSPIYNTDGMMMFLYNRMRGFHVGIDGYISKELGYRVLGSYRKSWGNGSIPLIVPATSTSMLFEAEWKVPSVRGLSLKGQFAFDHGTLLGNNTGACITLRYAGSFNL
ncbi:MAG: capsule assembly Wzi family protein [Bacteroidales bacterium]|nr:capsule assembly Wzi family protein [Bacteroidales bacterium]